ncbi:MAG: hypothetical protein HOQ22_12430 [Nocardioidaceae bacterium]|nr:hypothetical protein [Nocardioidaceae bacterium]NUS51827.1 hypothetical protein [Nocardioidaceae bacterium]
MAKRTRGAGTVFLHIGLPKTGTTFLQASLEQNKPALKEAGIRYPSGKDDRMFRAALDVRGNHKAWGRRRADVQGTWDDLCRRARKHDGVTVISHELLAAASVHQVVAAMTMLKGLDVHVVVTARDPARQATAEWQEGIKHGRQLTFEQFRTKVLAPESENDYARRFHAAQDLPSVLSRWGAAVPEDRLHVVCCPPAGADRTELWRRFADVVGFDPAQHPPAGSDSDNRSLGTDEIDLLRRVNVALDRRLVQPAYGEVVKRYFAQRLLAGTGGRRPAVPPDLYDDLTVVAERWVKEIDRAGYPVHGDLADLLPKPGAPGPHPDDVDTTRQVESAVAATAELLVEVHRGRSEIARLEAERRRLKKRRKVLKRRLQQAVAGD